MKKIFYIAIITFIANISFSQAYEDMPVEIQAKMDRNKMEGLDIYSGVFISYDVKMTSLQAQNIDKMISSFNEDRRVVDVTITPDGSKIAILANASYSIKDIKSIIVAAGAVIEDYSTSHSMVE